MLENPTECSKLGSYFSGFVGSAFVLVEEHCLALEVRFATLAVFFAFMFAAKEMMMMAMSVAVMTMHLHSMSYATIRNTARGLIENPVDIIVTLKSWLPTTRTRLVMS